MGINIRRYGSTYAYSGVSPKIEGTEQIKTPYGLTYKSDSTMYNTPYYVPLVSAETPVTKGSIIKSRGTYHRCTSGTVYKGFLRVQINGKAYHAINMGAFVTSTYAIPAGTYTPEVFGNMILSFIARGSGQTRAVDRATSFTVNSQTVSLASGGLIRYQYQGSSPFHLDFVTFGRLLGTNEFWRPNASFTTYKAYCVSTGGQGDAGHQFATYYNYSITVNTSFNFS